MITQTSTIRIYVASLADYNAGVLHGRWIDAQQDGADIQEQVNYMLSLSTQDIAEEWAIHDYEGFQGLHIEEYESFTKVAELADAVAQHGVPFALWHNYIGVDELRQDFTDHYLGEFDSVAQYAEEFYDYISEDVPDALRYHIDWEGVGRDMEQDGMIVEIDGHIFSGY